MKLNAGTFIGLFLGACIVALGLSAGKIIENVDSGKTVVIQDAWDGDLTVYQKPGIAWQWFGTVTEYDQSNQYWFEEATAGDTDDGAKRRGCFNLRFNDQGTANLCGSVTFDFPTDESQILAIHKKYRSQNGVVERLVKPAISRAIYSTGPLMSSRESAGEKRSDLTGFILDQANVGIYKVALNKVEVTDEAAEPIKTITKVSEPLTDDDGAVVLNEDGTPKMHLVPKVTLTKATKTVKVSSPVMKDGRHVLQEKSALASFGMRLYGLTITGVKYDKRVNEQIQAQQKAMMSIQTARAQSTKAIQDALTAEAKGAALEAKTKAAEAVKTVQQEAEAKRKVTVAHQALLEAEEKAKAIVAMATAKAKAKELLAEADGSLTQKLATMEAIAKFKYAAMAKQPQVPHMVVGAVGAAGTGGLSNNPLIDVVLLKQLGVDMSLPRR